MIEFPTFNGPAQYTEYKQMATVAVQMQNTGWRIDKERVAQHTRDTEARAKPLKEEILNLTGLDPGDTGAGPTWKKYFLETLGLPPVSFDKQTRKPQLNSADLLTYANDWPDESVRAKARALWLYRKNTKLLTAFLYPLMTTEGDRVHPSFNITGTKGARWSASKPNIQQVSKDVTEKKEGKEFILVPSFKDVFVADEGCLLIKADMVSFELFLQEHIGRISQITAWREAGLDPHIEVALYLFGLPRLESQKEMKKKYEGYRAAAKTLNYGLPYNSSDNVEQVWKQIKQVPELKKITVEEAKMLRKRYFRLMGETLAWQGRTKDQIDDNGWIEAPIMQRRLYLQQNMRGYNQANNFQMQTSGGDIINRAIVDLYPQLDWAQGEQIRAQVHDEIVAQAPEGRVDHIVKLVEAAMSAPIKIGDKIASFPAEVSVGKNWKQTVSLEKWFKGVRYVSS